MNGPVGAGVPADRLLGPTLRRLAVLHPRALPYSASPGSGSEVPAIGSSYAVLDRRARAVAARLGATLPPGSRVLLAYPQGPDLAAALFGCLYAGMSAIPCVPGEPAVVRVAAERCAPAAVLTGADTRTPLRVDRSRTEVIEADGMRVGGSSVRILSEAWRPVGVLRTAPAYRRYVPDGTGDGRLEPAMDHGALADVLGELEQAARLGTAEENIGWMASVHGIEDAVWRVLLPVHEGRGV